MKIVVNIEELELALSLLERLKIEAKELYEAHYNQAEIEFKEARDVHWQLKHDGRNDEADTYEQKVLRKRRLYLAHVEHDELPQLYRFESDVSNKITILRSKLELVKAKLATRG